MIGTGGIVAEKHPVRECHVFPFPAARVAGLAGGEEASHLDHLSPALLYLRVELAQELAQRGV